MRTCLQEPRLGPSQSVPLRPATTILHFTRVISCFAARSYRRPLPGVERHVGGDPEHAPSGPWLLSRSMAVPSQPVGASSPASLLLIPKWCAIAYVHPSLRTPSAGDGRLARAQGGAVLNTPAVSIHKQVSSFIQVRLSLGVCLGGAAGPWRQRYV